MSNPNGTSSEGSEFRYLPDFDFLRQQFAPSTSSTCEVLNVQPLDTMLFQQRPEPKPREMRSRQHLQYEVIRTFNDSNEFDQWWTHEGGCNGWIFNTIYKKKTEDEVHVYRCGHRACSLRLRVVFVANSCDVRVEQALIEHMHDDNAPKVDSIKSLSSEVKGKIAVLEDMGLTATKIRRSLFKESNNGNLPTLKQVQNYIARLRNKRASPLSDALASPSAVVMPTINSGPPIQLPSIGGEEGDQESGNQSPVLSQELIKTLNQVKAPGISQGKTPAISQGLVANIKEGPPLDLGQITKSDFNPISNSNPELISGQLSSQNAEQPPSQPVKKGPEAIFSFNQGPTVRKRGRPRHSDRIERVFPPALSNPAPPKFVDPEPKPQPDDEEDSLGQLDEVEAFQKFSQLLESCQPTMKRQRLSYHFERSFQTKDEFTTWWAAQKYDGMVHNSTYANNAGEQIDIYRCSKRDCHHRIRIVYNPSDGTVCVEKTDVGHDISAHESKSTLTRNAKMAITEMHERGMKPKAIRTHFLQSTAKASEVPSMTQIKNLVNRLKMKQKVDVTSSSMDNTSEGFSFLGDQTTTNVFDQIENGLNGLNGLMGN